MLPFLLRRLLGAVLVMLAISFITFVLLNSTPGDAADSLIGEVASLEEMDALRAQLGLDMPLLTRYGIYLKQAVLQNDLGNSLMTGRPVATLILDRLPYTVKLAASSLLVALVIGSLVGFAAATRSGGWLDLTLMSVTTLGLSIPTFWVALLLIQFFAVKLRWLPVVGAGTPAHLVLPTICLALPLAAVIARLVRASLLDVKEADYIRTARSKGLRSTTIWRRHLLRNAVIPVLTLLGLYAGRMLAGAVVIETIFAWPGLGRLTVQAILDSDFPVVLGAVLLIAALYQLLTLSVDVMHAVIDPRVGRSAL
jgi:ABC-type dipeptide/oligopeptide/nickel transport system permease component